MTPFEAYTMYSAIHAHFTSKYDYFKYNGQMRLSKDSFDKRNDKYMYQKLSQHKAPQVLVLASHVYTNVKWVGQLFEEDAHQAMLMMQRFQSNVPYHYKQELADVLFQRGGLDQVLKVEEGQHPILLQLLIKSKVSYETVVIMNDVLNFMPYWDRKITDTLLWPKYKKTLEKLKPFMVFDSVELKGITREVCLNNEQTM